MWLDVVLYLDRVVLLDGMMTRRFGWCWETSMDVGALVWLSLEDVIV